MTEPARIDWSEDGGRGTLLARAEDLLHRPTHTVLGSAGAPGAGKSTISEWLVTTLAARYPGEVALLPLDAYHLEQTVIVRRGAAHRKGAPDTYDALSDGFAVGAEEGGRPGVGASGA